MRWAARIAMPTISIECSQHTDRNGLTFYYEYERSDDAWRVVRSWGDGGLYAYEFVYLDAARERRIRDSLGNVWLVKIDERGLPISEIDPLGGLTSYAYDESARTVAVEDQDGHRTEYEFDVSGNLQKLTRADGGQSPLSSTSMEGPWRSRI